MTLDIDRTRPLRSIPDLRRLLQAAFAAHETDEENAVEWKSKLPLNEAKGRFQVARAIIGFANRRTERAQLDFGGLAYIIVGLTPGSCEGIEKIDKAQLDDGIRIYTGSDGPIWVPTYLTFGDKDVLVVSVEAPVEGQPVYVLEKQYEQYKGRHAIHAG